MGKLIITLLKLKKSNAGVLTPVNRLTDLLKCLKLIELNEIMI